MIFIQYHIDYLFIYFCAIVDLSCKRAKSNNVDDIVDNDEVFLLSAVYFGNSSFLRKQRLAICRLQYISCAARRLR